MRVGLCHRRRHSKTSTHQACRCDESVCCHDNNQHPFSLETLSFSFYFWWHRIFLGIFIAWIYKFNGEIGEECVCRCVAQSSRWTRARADRGQYKYPETLFNKFIVVKTESVLFFKNAFVIAYGARHAYLRCLSMCLCMCVENRERSGDALTNCKLIIMRNETGFAALNRSLKLISHKK